MFSALPSNSDIPMKLALRIFAKLGSYVLIRSPRRRGEWKHSRAPVAKMIPISTD